MERLIDFALGLLIVVLTLASAAGVWAAFRAYDLGQAQDLLYGMRVAGQSLFGLVVAAALASIRKRLSVIERGLRQ